MAKSYNQKGLDAFHTGNYQQAIAEYSAGIQYHNYPFCYANRAIAKHFLDSRDWTAAEDLFDAMSSLKNILNSYHPMYQFHFSKMIGEWHNHQGLQCSAKKEYPLAIAHFFHATLYDGKNAIYLANLALATYSYQPQDMSAVYNYLIALKLQPDISNSYPPHRQAQLSELALIAAQNSRSGAGDHKVIRTQNITFFKMFIPCCPPLNFNPTKTFQR